MRATVGAALLYSLVMIVLAVILPDVMDAAETARTELATQTGMSCTPGAGETSCDVTLDTEHAYAITDGMTVTETAPGSTDRTDDTTVGADRLTLTIAGLTALQPYTFTVEHRVVDPTVSPQAAGLVERFGFLLIVGVTVLFGIWVIRTWIM